MSIKQRLFCHLYQIFILIALPFYSYEFTDWKSDENPQKWNNQAKQTLDDLLKSKINQNVAKNLIIFLGDGMGISTVTSGRIRKGQKLGLHNKPTSLVY